MDARPVSAHSRHAVQRLSTSSLTSVGLLMAIARDSARVDHGTRCGRCESSCDETPPSAGGFTRRPTSSCSRRLKDDADQGPSPAQRSCHRHSTANRRRWAVIHGGAWAPRKTAWPRVDLVTIADKRQRRHRRLTDGEVVYSSLRSASRDFGKATPNGAHTRLLSESQPAFR
jgi:hypothetical protein